MRKNLLKLPILLLSLIASISGIAQAFTLNYNFANVTTTSGRTDPTPTPKASGLVADSFRAVGALSTNAVSGGRFNFSQWPTGATSSSNSFTGYLDPTRYFEVKVTPLTGYQLTISSITFTLQRSATGVRQWSVRSNTDGFLANLPASVEPANANIIVADSSKFQIADRATTTALIGSKVTISNFQNSSNAVTFRFYGFNAEGSTGTFSLNAVNINGSVATAAGAAVLTVAPTALNFAATAVNATSSFKTYLLKGENLTGPVTLTTSSPYLISSDNLSYATTLNIPANAVDTNKIVYVKFAPASAASFSGSITNSSPGAATKTVTLSGDGIDPNNLTFNFDNCSAAGTPGSGFLSYSVNGAQNWSCSNFGRNNTKGVDINGYAGGPQENEDWLISPPLLFGALNLPILRFWSKGEFSGPTLQLLVSTNYDGSSNPNTATWTDLNVSFPAPANTWTITDGIDLSAYKSFPRVFIAFKYISSVEFGAARWTVDDVDVSNRSALLTTSPSLLSFGEASAGSSTPGLPFLVKAVGYSNITLVSPAGFKVSSDSAAYVDSLVIPATVAQSGAKLFARFSPTTKALQVDGLLRFKGAGLDSMTVALTGSSYPKSETFDAGCYNLSFFGSNPTNNPTQEKISLQIANIATVLQRLNLDVVGVEEVSNDTALANLVRRLPNRSAIISNRWSYSFDPPDPNFPPQKTGFIFDTTTMRLVEARDMFVSLYDSVRNGFPQKLPNYPGGTPSSFWASGRLPFMATFDATIAGITRRIRVIDIHAKSASDVASFNRRAYDAKVLKDTLDAYYPSDYIIIVGDYNDRLAGSIYSGSATSSYQPFVNDSANYTSLTYPLDAAGRVSFLTGTGLIDHIITSSELKPMYISNSTNIEDPRSYIAGYSATTASDHFPVLSRFLFSNTLPVTLTNFAAAKKGNDVYVTWQTVNEIKNSHFVVTRSSVGRDFTTIGRQDGLGTGSSQANYQFIDNKPRPGVNYYRLEQVDLDGKTTLSNIVSVNFSSSENSLNIYPNPVVTSIKINLNSSANNFEAKITSVDGSLRIKAAGDVNQLNQQINKRMSSLVNGVYILTVKNAVESHVVKFIKQ